MKVGGSSYYVNWCPCQIFIHTLENNVQVFPFRGYLFSNSSHVGVLPIVKSLYFQNPSNLKTLRYLNELSTKHLVVQWVIGFNRIIFRFWKPKLNCSLPLGALKATWIVQFGYKMSNIFSLKIRGVPFLKKNLLNIRSIFSRMGPL